MYIFLYVIFHSFLSYSQDTFIVYGKKSYTLTTLNPNKSNQLEQKELSKILNFDSLFSSSSGYNIINNGGTQSIFFRGTDSSHLTLIKDGLIFNDSINPNRQVDFNQISLNSISNSELIAGSESSFFGSNSIGGVLILNSGKKENSFQLKNGSNKKNSVSLNLYNSAELGEFYLNSNYDKHSSFSQVSENRVNNDFDPQKTISNYLKWESQIKNSSQFKITFDQFYSFQNLDNGALDDDPNDSIMNKYWQIGLNYIYEPSKLDKWFSSLGFRKSSREFNNLSDSFENSNSTTLTDSQNAQLNIVNTHKVNNELILNSQFNFSNEQLNQFKMSAFSISELIQYFYNNQLFQIGARLDYSKNNFENFSYKGSWDYNLSSSTQFFYSISSGFKAPTLSQLKDPTYGNNNLKPEKSITNEFGYQHYYLDHVQIQLSTFITNINDLISFHPTTYQSINDGKVEIRGIEFSVINKLERFNHSHFINYSNSINKLNRNQLNRRPHLQLTNNLVLNLNETSELQFSHLFKSKSFDTYNGTRKTLNERHLFNAKTIFKKNQDLVFDFSLENIFNKKYQDVFGYNTQGANYLISVKYLF